MSYHSQRIEQLTEQYKAELEQLVDVSSGLPRPIIGLDNTMPVQMPVRQIVLARIKKIAHDTDNEFHLPTLEFLVHPYQNQNEDEQRLAITEHPYKQLSAGDVVDRMEDGSEIILGQVIVEDVPSSWRSQTPLDLYIRARAKHKRYGEMLAVSERINLRVPRQGIKGKATGI